MRMSGLPNFKIRWGWINQTIPEGSYNLIVTNNYNSTDWDGSREFILTTWSAAGGNYLIPVAFLVIAVISFTTSTFFCYRMSALKKNQSPIER